MAMSWTGLSLKFKNHTPIYMEMTLYMAHMKLKWIRWNLSEVIANFCTRDYYGYLIFVGITFHTAVSWQSSKLPIENTIISDFMGLIIVIYLSQGKPWSSLWLYLLQWAGELLGESLCAIFHPIFLSMTSRSGVHYCKVFFNPLLLQGSLMPSH